MRNVNDGKGDSGIQRDTGVDDEISHTGTYIQTHVIVKHRGISVPMMRYHIQVHTYRHR